MPVGLPFTQKVIGWFLLATANADYGDNVTLTHSMSSHRVHFGFLQVKADMRGAFSWPYVMFACLQYCCAATVRGTCENWAHMAPAIVQLALRNRNMDSASNDPTDGCGTCTISRPFAARSVGQWATPETLNRWTCTVGNTKSRCLPALYDNSPLSTASRDGAVACYRDSRAYAWIL